MHRYESVYTLAKICDTTALGDWPPLLRREGPSTCSGPPTLALESQRLRRRQWAFLISICPWFLRRGTNANSQPCPCFPRGPGCCTRFATTQIHAMWKCRPKHSQPGHLWKFPPHIYCDAARTFVKFSPTHGHLSAACLSANRIRASWGRVVLPTFPNCMAHGGLYPALCSVWGTVLYGQSTLAAKVTAPHRGLWIRWLTVEPLCPCELMAPNMGDHSRLSST